MLIERASAERTTRPKMAFGRARPRPANPRDEKNVIGPGIRAGLLQALTCLPIWVRQPSLKWLFDKLFRVLK
jgi:hypothetical protein